MSGFMSGNPVQVAVAGTKKAPRGAFSFQQQSALRPGCTYRLVDIRVLVVKVLDEQAGKFLRFRIVQGLVGPGGARYQQLAVDAVDGDRDIEVHDVEVL